jgi:hypothetical protein
MKCAIETPASKARNHSGGTGQRLPGEQSPLSGGVNGELILWTMPRGER